ncbi:hypothetical protein AB4X15_25605 [Peribacillus simplex]|uniref:hypothetical protein n=1 Tax=Peribacillus simplex TaxID=1478 RepID=UPI0034E8850A
MIATQLHGHWFLFACQLLEFVRHFPMIWCVKALGSFEKNYKKPSRAEAKAIVGWQTKPNI